MDGFHDWTFMKLNSTVNRFDEIVGDADPFQGSDTNSEFRLTLYTEVKTGSVRVYPWQRDGEIERQVTIDIRQLHGGADGYAVLEAGWRIYQLPERKLVASRTFVAREELTADGYPALVAAQSRLLAKLADDIAAGMRR